MRPNEVLVTRALDRAATQRRLMVEFKQTLSQEENDLLARFEKVEDNGVECFGAFLISIYAMALLAFILLGINNYIVDIPGFEIMVAISSVDLIFFLIAAGYWDLKIKKLKKNPALQELKRKSIEWYSKERF